MKSVYFDNAATTPVDKEFVLALSDLLENQYLNADSLYEGAVSLKSQLESARSKLASLLKVESEEIIFNSGASEGNNMIIKGLLDYYPKRTHIITTNIEHPSVTEVFNYYEKLGYKVNRVPVNTKGEFDFNYLADCIREDTLLVSVMAVNNETGLILPLEKIKTFIREKSRAFFHSDMTQALGKMTLDLSIVDFASFSAHKLGGFKGTGFIYKKKGTNLIPLIHGGQQEFNQRAGTSNAPYQILLPNIVEKALNENGKKIVELNALLKNGLKEIEGVKINSCLGSPYILNFSLPNMSSQTAINALSNKGIMISGQATCSTSKSKHSLVLRNMGFPLKDCQNVLRVSLWHQNTKEEIEYFVACLKEVDDEYGL